MPVEKINSKTGENNHHGTGDGGYQHQQEELVTGFVMISFQFAGKAVRGFG